MVKTWADNVPYPDKISAEAAMRRLSENLAAGHAYKGTKGVWGFSCPGLETETELAPASERAAWLRKIRDVRLG